MIKLKAYIKHLKWLCDVITIDYSEEIIEVDLTNGNGDTSIYNFDEVAIFQSIGLTDENKRELFIGDIIEYHRGYNVDIGVIVPFKEELSVVLEDKSGGISIKTHSHNSPWTINYLGNVIDNPELVEEHKLHVSLKNLINSEY